MRPYLVGNAGGRGSGTRPFADALAELFGGAPILSQENYFRSEDALSFPEREKMNYDHPAALDAPLMVAHLRTLRWGNPVAAPVFDRTRLLRAPDTVTVAPAPLILAEGSLLFTDADLAAQFDLRVFLDTPADIRLVRLLLAGEERRESLCTMLEKYMATVRPSYDRYIAPTRACADRVVTGDGTSRAAAQEVAEAILAAMAAR